MCVWYEGSRRSEAEVKKYSIESTEAETSSSAAAGSCSIGRHDFNIEGTDANCLSNYITMLLWLLDFFSDQTHQT